MRNQVSLFYYIESFALAFAVVNLAKLIILNLAKVDVGYVVNLIPLMIALYYASANFVKDHERIPSDSERVQLSFATLIVYFLLFFLIKAIFVALAGKKLSLAFAYFIYIKTAIFSGGWLASLSVLALHYLLIWFFYGWLPKLKR